MKRYVVCYRELKKNKTNGLINQIEIDATCRTDAFSQAKHRLREYFGNDNLTLWVYAYVNKKTNNYHCFCTFDGKEL